MIEPRAYSRALLAALVLGLVLRLGAAVVVDSAARRQGSICLFPDANIYWQLADAILRGGPYRVFQWEVPHDALRTPGFPVFLAVCRAIGGDPTLFARVAQAVLGTVAIGLNAWLIWLVRPSWRLVAITAWLTALDPFVVGFTPLLLSEALFLPLLLAMLVGLGKAWHTKRADLASLTTGLAGGCAILVKPSFALFVPLILGPWLISAPKLATLRKTALVGLGAVMIMSPWWVRNVRHYQRFVATALWGGASLYDGLNPEATGASDMRFLERDDLRTLDEVAQDEELKRRAWQFCREHPDRVMTLALAKAARFWSPWLNADAGRSNLLMVATTLWTVPLYLLILVGLWRLRHLHDHDRGPDLAPARAVLAAGRTVTP